MIYSSTPPDGRVTFVNMYAAQFPVQTIRSKQWHSTCHILKHMINGNKRQRKDLNLLADKKISL